MSPGYKLGLTIERINNDGNYEPNNCRWATKHDQHLNKRSSIYLEIDGIKQIASEWSKVSGIKSETIYIRYRIYGWGAREAVFKPARQLRKIKTLNDTKEPPGQ